MNQKWIAFLRIVVGIFFIGEGLGKLGWYSSSEFLKLDLDRFAQNAPAVSAWYQRHVAYPGIEAWARLIPTGEMLIGIALVIGVLTLPVLIAAFLLVLNFNLTNGVLFSWRFFSNPYALLLLSCILMLINGKAGSVFALDTKMRRSRKL
ncbi:MAG: DoxX family membrane protein [Bacteroidota bacterium]|nr:DoxX family membrane protein [Bacteroidota bacterium]